MDLAFQGWPWRKEVFQPWACWHRACSVPQILTAQREGKGGWRDRGHSGGYGYEMDRLKRVQNPINLCAREQKELASNETILKCEVQSASEEPGLGQSILHK